MANVDSSAIPEFQEEDTLRVRVQLPIATDAAQPARDRCTLTVVEGPQLGAVHVMTGGEMVVGRSRHVEVSLEDPGSSRRQARIFRRGDGFFIEDLGSTNGTWVGGRRLTSAHRLTDGERIQVGASTVISFHQQDAAEQQVARRLYESAVRDPLTRLYNRRYLDERLRAEHAYSERHDTPLSVLLIDIDHFKMINDGFGHSTGDAVLRIVAQTLSRILRTEDLIARYGGEEFCAVLRGINIRNARIVAERLRRTVEALALPWQGRTLHVTVSIGVATGCGSRPARTPQSLIDAADAALYRAKRTGRNRCCEA